MRSDFTLAFKGNADVMPSLAYQKEWAARVGKNNFWSHTTTLRDRMTKNFYDRVHAENQWKEAQKQLDL